MSRFGNFPDGCEVIRGMRRPLLLLTVCAGGVIVAGAIAAVVTASPSSPWWFTSGPAPAGRRPDIALTGARRIHSAAVRAFFRSRLPQQGFGLARRSTFT